MSGATRYTALPSPMPLHRGGEISAGVIAYETWGTLNAARDNAILIVTGMSPSAHAASGPLDPTPGWWEPMIGRDRSFDTERYFIVCVNSLGSCKGSTGPASAHPDDGLPYRLRFPSISIEDVADGAAAVDLALAPDGAAVDASARDGGPTAFTAPRGGTWAPDGGAVHFRVASERATRVEVWIYAAPRGELRRARVLRARGRPRVL